MAKLKTQRAIEWDINELARFKELIQSIKARSIFLAERIKSNVQEKLYLIQQNPYMYEADSLKVNNDGSFRKFNAIHIRIVYKIEEDKIIIVRVRHVLSEPIDY